MLKKIKSLFIVEEEESRSSKSTSQKKEPKSGPPSPGKNVPAPAPVSAGGKVTDKFINILMEALEKNNLEGFDYLEYKRSLESLKKMSMDEATRYQSAFAMAQTMGVSAPKLIETTKHYLDVLASEQQKFQQAVANQQTGAIQGKENEIKNLDLAIRRKQEEIKQMTKEIEQHNKKMAKLKDEISSTAGKVEATKQNFTASYQLLVGQIQSDHEKMRQYLK